MVIDMDEMIYPCTNPMYKPRTAPRRRAPTEKGRTPYDALRPWSAITHGLGVVLSIFGTLLLIFHTWRSGGSLRYYATFVVYGLSMITLYTASTLYHCLNTTVKGRIALRKIDHTSIYLLIAGTYTPICLVSLRGTWGWSLFVAIWVLAILGAFSTLIWINSPRWVTAGLYLFMGWLALIAIYPITEAISFRGLFWLLSGGILYTIGGILYALKWPGRNNPRFGCHEIFHVFILLGSVCHYLLMYRVIAPA